MPGPVQSRRMSARNGVSLGAVITASLCLFAPGVAVGQVHGVPPSVTSIQFHVPPFLPNARPSVTSVGPYPAYNSNRYPPPYGIPRNLCPWGCRHRGSNGIYGGGYYTPVYVAVPYYNDASDSDPYLYSGPPPEQTAHVVVDLPPDRHAAAPSDDEQFAYAVPPPRDDSEAQPIDATILVFRDGHQQEVLNYAIMGQTLYVVDTRTQKIGLGDLDLPATIKVNDDRGVDFHVPAHKQS